MMETIQDAVQAQPTTKMEEREALILELQDVITELHQDMSLKGQHELQQLQQLLQLEAKVKELQEQVQGSEGTIVQLRLELAKKAESSSATLNVASSDFTNLRGTELLKSELSRRDASIQRLRQDLLLSHQARDAQSVQLDVQEQRLWDLQRELQESQQELQRGNDRYQQLHGQLQDARKQDQELQAQLSEVKGNLVKLENEGLLGIKKHQTTEVERVTAELGLVQSTVEQKSKEAREARKKCHELEDELSIVRAHLSRCQEGTHGAKNTAEQIQRLEEEVSRLKSQRGSVSQQEWCRLRRAQEELKEREEEWKKDKTFLQEQLDGVREELHRANLREEEHRLKVLQIDELQREVDKTLALLEKEREDCIKAEELERLREEQLKDKVSHQEEWIADLQRQLEKAGFDQKEKELKEWKERWYSVSESLGHTHIQLQQAQNSLEIQQEKNHSLQDDVDKLHTALVEERSTVSRLKHELQEAEHQRDLLGSGAAELNWDFQQKDCRRLAEQDEVSSRDETVRRLTADLRAAQENLTAAQEEKAEQMQQVMSKEEEVVALQKEVSRLQEILKQREDIMEKSKHNTTQLHRETDSLYSQCEVQKEEFCDLREEVQQWQQVVREQKESRVKEVQALEEENHLQQHRDNLASCRAAALRSQDAELTELKAGLLEAEKLATDAEARLQPLSESLELCKHKYQACLSKIAQLENTLHGREEDLREAHNRVAEREEQVLRLRAQVVAAQGDLQVHRAQLETGDDALAALSQQLRDTLRELEHSRERRQECELLISTLRDTAAALRRQIDEQEEMVAKTQADFSIYRATHVHSDSDYESQLSRVQELEHALFQSLERCGQSAQELRVCQVELARHRDSSAAEVQRLQEQVRKLQADAAEEGRRREQVDALEQKVARLERELQAAQRQCDQAIQKRDPLLRQSEADLLQARERIRSKAAEAERQAVFARGLEADLQRAKKVKRQREKECALLKTQMLQLREQLKEAHNTCRDTAQELMQQQEKEQLLERGQRLAQEQLSERVKEVVQAEKAQRKLQAELKRITECLESTQLELQDSRRMLEQMKTEASSSRQEALGLQQKKQQIQEELDISRETVTALQTKLCEQEKLLNTHQERVCELEATIHRLQEEEVNSQNRLQLCRRDLETKDEQVQKHYQEMSSLQATVSRLKLDLQQEQERWRQGIREAAKADQRGRELRLELSAAQASHKEYMELLAEYSREVTAQRSEQGRLQQCLIQLTEERESQEERVRQMSADLQRAHNESRCSQEEARACEGRLAELQTQLTRSLQWTEARDQEVLVLEIEMASLRDNYTAKAAQVEALLSQMDAVNQKYSTAVCEADVLRQCLGDARSDSSRLHRESELVVTNVNQWVKEQKHTNEKLALKIKEQSRKIIHLTAEREHLQENAKGLQGEIRRLKAELDKERMEAERLKRA
ncbi:trichohyalin isoform X2 [Puntigrus tetrazona]|uniref:trichohyalin isoform X2 n=1 Tax=Puntigrus tetrazona TaxID=1606681 RepID=UPI001C8A8E7B|nr:trichohyalin isoform X2 [Puntigrus tetrazona]